MVTSRRSQRQARARLYYFPVRALTRVRWPLDNSKWGLQKLLRVLEGKRETKRCVKREKMMKQRDSIYSFNKFLSDSDVFVATGTATSSTPPLDYHADRTDRNSPRSDKSNTLCVGDISRTHTYKTLSRCCFNRRYHHRAFSTFSASSRSLFRFFFS